MTKTTPSATSSDWIFDDSEIPDPHKNGERAARFNKALRHPKSNIQGHAFHLDRWQELIIRYVSDTRADGAPKGKTVFALVLQGNR